MKPIHEMTVAEALEVANRRELNRRMGRPLDAPTMVTGMSTLVPTPPRHRGMRDEPSEHDIQVAFFANVDDPGEQARRPALALTFAVPNGGHRSPAVAAKLKAEGVKAGVLDVWCPAPRGGYVGWVAEFKKPGGATSPAQASWLAALAAEGWKAELHTVPTEAFRALCHYLDQPRTSLTPPPPRAA